MTTVEEICVHHWIIETPDGATSHGVCKKCGASQDFPNWIDKLSYALVTSHGDPLNFERDLGVRVSVDADGL